MKRQWSIFAIVLLVSAGSACAFDLLVEGYTLEDYAQYSSTTWSYRMVFDDSGNLYINHFDSGRIRKIDPTGQVSTFVTGLTGVFDMAWGGGTAYGNYLYATTHPAGGGHNIYQIDSNGNATQFTPMDNRGPCAINIDRTGNYSNQMYVTTSINDRTLSVTTSGTVSTFTGWPGEHPGGVYGIAFDTTGDYNGRMYVTSTYGSGDADISGLFKVSPSGATVTRFSSSLAGAGEVDFDTTGLYFDHDMFVMGRTNFVDPLSLWRVLPDGTAQEFMRDVRSFAFGSDGAMYVSYYDWSTQVVSVARVVPEPATLLLLAAGGLFLKRR